MRSGPFGNADLLRQVAGKDERPRAATSRLEGPRRTRPHEDLTLSSSSLPALKNGTALAGTWTAAPVLGLRPCFARRLRVRKLPKPRSSTLSPLSEV